MQIMEMPVPALQLGESPVWDVQGQRLFWIDGQAKAIFSADFGGKDLRRWEVPVTIGSIALRAGGGLLVAAEDGLSFFDLVHGSRECFADPEREKDHVALNDGKVDRAGRFVVGSIDHLSYANAASAAEIGPGRASLYRLDADLTIVELATELRNVNGPCWSPDDRTFYFSDTLAGTVFGADWDSNGGTFADRREFLSLASVGIMPDGAAIDEEGCYWCACVGAGQIRRYAPNGELLRTVELPVAMVTSMTFGGADLDSIYVTSLTYPPSADGQTGRLLRIDDIGVRGMPQTAFAG